MLKQTFLNANITAWRPIDVTPIVREGTASKLALLLVIMLAGTIVIHYAAVILWGADAGKKEELSHLFSAWLPILSGLAGSAATYYFTRDKSRR